jgi:phospholipase/carboxylesterase
MKILESAATIQLEPAEPANAAVIWLHGLGADGNDFVPLVPELRLPKRIAARFIFPHGPVRPVTLNGGMPMRAWYDIVALTRAGRQDDAGIRASAATVQQLIEREVAAGMPRDHIVLAGFSQGGAIALHAGLRQAEPLAGVLALSTYLPLEQSVLAELTAAGRTTPILMCHGRYDNVVQMALGSAGCDGLRQLGCKVEWKEYPMQHEVCAEEIDAVSQWLQARLA